MAEEAGVEEVGTSEEQVRSVSRRVEDLLERCRSLALMLGTCLFWTKQVRLWRSRNLDVNITAARFRAY